MKPKKNQRPSAEDTRHKILKAARKLFMSKGFTATSMSQIAELANVNQSLISHHFDDKEGLWQSVKEDVVGTPLLSKRLNQEPKSVKEFLGEAINFRLELYSNCPDLERLVSWERLEKSITAKTMVDPLSHKPFVDNWLHPIQYLIDHGKIKKNLPAELIFIWVIMSTNAIVMDELSYFKNNAGYKEIYIEMILDGILAKIEA